MHSRSLVAMNLLITVASGCATYRPTDEAASRLAIEPRSGHRARQVVSEADEPTGVLDLTRATAVALRRNPELAAIGAEVRARDAAVVQAGLRPNPAMSGSVENVSGSAGTRLAETTAQLEQLLELGGKRSARVRLAGLNRELAYWDYQVRQNDVLRQVAEAYVELVTAQERRTVTGDLVRLA